MHSKIDSNKRRSINLAGIWELNENDYNEQVSNAVETFMSAYK